jgi:hypothetical protein
MQYRQCPIEPIAKVVPVKGLSAQEQLKLQARKLQQLRDEKKTREALAVSSRTCPHCGRSVVKGLECNNGLVVEPCPLIRLSACLPVCLSV